MALMYDYSIHNFYWRKDKNTFYAYGWELIPFEPYKGQDRFPGNKEQFTITNPDTGGFRRFRFVEEVVTELVDNGYSMGTETDWVFESEDGIKCVIFLG